MWLKDLQIFLFIRFPVQRDQIIQMTSDEQSRLETIPRTANFD